MGLALSELHDIQKSCSMCYLVSVLFIKLLFTCYKISITAYHSIPFSTFTRLTNQSPLSNSIKGTFIISHRKPIAISDHSHTPLHTILWKILLLSIYFMCMKLIYKKVRKIICKGIKKKTGILGLGLYRVSVATTSVCLETVRSFRYYRNK